jgi:hypothetical protein
LIAFELQGMAQAAQEQQAMRTSHQPAWDSCSRISEKTFEEVGRSM